MALSITPANVALGSSATVYKRFQAGESVTQGQPFYRHTDGLCYQSDANASAQTGNATGIALTPAAANGYFIGVTSGPIIIGATVVQAQAYGISTTKGGIDLVSAFTIGDYPVTLGLAPNTAQIDVNIQVAGVIRTA